MDVAHGEAVEASLDAFIAQCHDKRMKAEGRDRPEELWMANERRYRERTVRLWERLRYHEGQAKRLSATVAELVAGHEAEAERCAQMLGIETTKGAA